MLFLIIFLLISAYVVIFKRKYSLYYFFVVYPILPDYFAIELGGGLPLLKSSRILILLMAVFILIYQRGKIYIDINSLKKTKMLIPLFIYFVGRITANAFYCFNLSAAMNTEFSIIFEQLILVIILLQVIKSKQQIKQCMKTLACGSAISAIVSIISIICGKNLFYYLNTVSRSMLMASTVRMGIVRAEAGFGHPVYYGVYCALVIPICYYLYENEKKKIYILICFLNIIALLFTESRGSIAALIFMFAVVLIKMDGKRRRKLFRGLFIVLMVGSIISLLIPSLTQQITNIFKSMFAIMNTNIEIDDFGGNSTTGLDSRLIQFTGVLWTIMNNAFFGLGASCHTRGVLKYYKESIGWFETTTIDNGFVGYFVQEGILGTVGFCTLLVSIIRLSNKFSNKKDKSNINNVFVICFLVYLVEMFSVADSSQVFWLIIILFLKYNSLERLK